MSNKNKAYALTNPVPKQDVNLLIPLDDAMPTKILNLIYPVAYPNFYPTPSPISHMSIPLS